MAALKEIRIRIKSVKNTQKITKAMKLVAASKLGRAQEAITAARPYATALDQALRRVAGALEGAVSDYENPLLESRDVRHLTLVVMTSDRGLCGAFNSSIIKQAEAFIQSHPDKTIRIVAVGRKGAEYFKRRGLEFEAPEGIFEGLSYDKAEQLAKRLANDFETGKTDAVHVLFNEFKSAINQVPTFTQLVPVSTDEESESATGTQRDYIYEPDPTGVLDALLPTYISSQMWKTLLDSVAAEHGARMTAMDSATNNATELSDKLTLADNRARQAAITQELMEIVGGCEAINQ